VRSTWNISSLSTSYLNTNKFKQLSFRGISGISYKSSLADWWLTGFTDAEGCFRVSILKNKVYKTGWLVRPSFQICLHSKDKAILELIKLKLGIGKIYTTGLTAVSFEVYGIKELEVIIAHFDKYPLISQKRSDYELFKLAMGYMRGSHLTMEGLKKLISIKASMNKGLNAQLKEAFPDVIPIVRPLIQDLSIPDPQWVTGFTSGEGCFMVRLKKSSTSPRGLCELIFQITQHTRDTQLLLKIKNYFDCGRYRERTGGLAGDFIVSKSSDLIKNIIPFYEKYPVIGVKAKNFEDFKKVAWLVQNKEHLTSSGLKEIQKIQAGMNRGRKT